MHIGWTVNMRAVQVAIVDQGGFAWQTFRGQSTPNQKECAAFMRTQCTNTSQMQTTATQYVTTNSIFHSPFCKLRIWPRMLM